MQVETKLLKHRSEADTCFSCHTDVRKSMFQRSTHLFRNEDREQRASCSTCHEPHGSIGEKMMRTATVNETCYACHAEYRGPYLFEHAPVRENCATCHKPHGSNKIRDVDGDRPSRFEESKSVRSGALFRRFNAESNPAGEREYLYLAGRNPSERDQQYLLEAGRYGRFRTSATWSAQPFVYSRGATSLLTTSAPGVYVVPDAIQANLQALDPPFTNTTTTPNPALIAAARASLAGSAVKTELVWDVTDQFTWRGEYEWEGWNRRHRQAARTNEHKLGTFLTYKPTPKIRTDLDYRYQTRTPVNYFSGPLEFPFLRMFDQAKRLRHDVRFRWQYAVTPKIGIAGDFNYLSDDYDQNFYGTTRYIERSGSVDLLYNPVENTTLYANYSREHYNTTLQSISKTAVPFDFRNRWNREDRNINDNVGVGVSTYRLKSRWLIDVNYAMNFGRSLMTTANLTGLAPTALTNATAYDFPEAKARLHEFSFDTNYQLRPNVAVGFRYLYEPFRLDDWQLDNLNSYPVDQLAPKIDGRRFLLLDSRYTDHNAHVFSFYIRFGK